MLAPLTERSMPWVLVSNYSFFQFDALKGAVGTTNGASRHRRREGSAANEAEPGGPAGPRPGPAPKAGAP